MGELSFAKNRFRLVRHPLQPASASGPPIDTYSLVKTLHIISATILFGTGLGTAFFFWSARYSDPGVQLFAARITVRADFLFTLPAVVVQPATGAWLVWKSGIDPRSIWILVSVGLYLFAGLCWLPVVCLQIKMKRMLQSSVDGSELDRHSYERLRRTWFALGWPAFLGLIAVFFLMVAKPGS
jgi:uncharacterized membrane protein